MTISVFKRYGHWAPLCGITLVSVVFELFGAQGRTTFAYQNSLVESSQFWRAITGHFTHLGWSHLFLNIAGLIGVWGLYGKVFRPIGWGVLLIFCALAISLGFYIFDPNIQTYVGLSGVLHGLLAAASITSLAKNINDPQSGFPIEDVFVLVGLCLKILYEQYAGAIPFTGALSGGAVVVNAHLYGALSGGLAGLAIVAGTLLRRPIKTSR